MIFLGVKRGRGLRNGPKNPEVIFDSFHFLKSYPKYFQSCHEITYLYFANAYVMNNTHTHEKFQFLIPRAFNLHHGQTDGWTWRKILSVLVC